MMGNKKKDQFKNFAKEDRFKKLRIQFEDAWETDFLCVYEPTYPLWHMALNLHKPTRLINDRSKNSPWGNRHDKRYIPERMDIDEIRAIAWGIWQQQFEPKMKEALSELILETAAITLLEVNKKVPEEVTSIDATCLFNSVFRISDAKKKLRLAVPPHGGARAKNRIYFSSMKDEAEFVLIVMLARPLWEHIIKIFEDKEYGPECLGEVSRSEKFNHFLGLYPVPQKMLKDVYKRKRQNRPELSPLGFALRHAGILITGEEIKFNTLKVYFYKYKKWITECIQQYPGEWTQPFSSLTARRTRKNTKKPA